MVATSSSSSSSSTHPAAKSRVPGIAPDVLDILVVDDSSTVRGLIADKLQELGRHAYDLHIDTADSGERAVEMADRKSYDLVFLDVEMPGIGGLEACRRIKGRESRTRVAMLSSRNSAEDHATGRAAGCDNYLTKPPHESDLRSILRLASLRKMSSR